MTLTTVNIYTQKCDHYTRGTIPPLNYLPTSITTISKPAFDIETKVCKYIGGHTLSWRTFFSLLRDHSRSKSQLGNPWDSHIQSDVMLLSWKS